MAVALGAIAVCVLTVDYGHPPWIALILAGSFATYGLMKKRIGIALGALAGLTVETALLAPFAVAALLWLEVTGRGTFAAHAPSHGLLLASTGVATAVPLLMFAAAARRVPLSTIGLLQFMTPVLQLLCGVLVLGEHVPASRWIGFSIVWLALLALSVDSLHGARSRSRAARTRSRAAAPTASSTSASCGHSAGSQPAAPSDVPATEGQASAPRGTGAVRTRP